MKYECRLLVFPVAMSYNDKIPPWEKLASLLFLIEIVVPSSIRHALRTHLEGKFSRFILYSVLVSIKTNYRFRFNKCINRYTSGPCIVCIIVPGNFRALWEKKSHYVSYFNCQKKYTIARLALCKDLQCFYTNSWAMRKKNEISP